ncbi:unnamed protein product [Phyllotreta striolata]|uniref:Uncharacterized protein n=1 Tax=Phyllotreta striolata TaxID=444603 RepID=A0A9P0E0D1_PHYSR|nr:unnamed protein product [Phyllotreta striolata]
MGVNRGRILFLLYCSLVFLIGMSLYFSDMFTFVVRVKEPKIVKEPPKFRDASYTSHQLKSMLSDNFTISTPGCKIPLIKPFDRAIKEFINNESLPVCNNGIPPLFASNLTSIYLIKSSLEKYNITQVYSLECCYRPFNRFQPYEGDYDNNIVLNNYCYYFDEVAHIQEEFVKVNCFYEEKKIYQDTFAFVPLKNKTTPEENPDRLNVLVFGIDSISRMNLYRQLPLTLEYLKGLEIVELLGYNKVGDNTFPNLIPVLTGLSESELGKSCWPNNTDYFDNCTFLWNSYKEKGFLTAYAEDSSWMGLFNYQRMGFIKQPTDYAYNYFNRYSEKVIGNSRHLNVIFCEGGRHVYKDFIDYTINFAKTMDANNLPYFGFFWEVGISHDLLNMPRQGDADFLRLFKTLAEGKHLDNTALIFMSDHGMRWGSIRETYQGRMEERLPFLNLLLPQSFRNKYPSAYNNLLLNSMRLTTPFDLHETLMDLADPPQLARDLNRPPSRGISLFRPIGETRTCSDAGIAEHWCTCTHFVDVDPMKVVEVAKRAVFHINGQLKGYAQCARLALDKVTDAKLIWNPAIQKTETSTNYLITFYTMPGGGLFEATVGSDERRDKFEVIGSVSRLNLYANQSNCITDFHLKLYCYCVSLLS